MATGVERTQKKGREVSIFTWLGAYYRVREETQMPARASGGTQAAAAREREPPREAGVRPIRRRD